MTQPAAPVQTSRTVLVLGAGGRLGAAAVRAFADAGWRVLAQQRRAPQQLPSGAVHLATPLHDTAALARQAAGAQAVVYAVNPPYTEWAQQMLPLARQGMDLAEQLGALFMLPGNVYAFGDSMPSRLDEHTPERPSTGKGRLRADLEAELRQRAQAGRLHAAVIRAGDFYGGGQGSWLDLAVVKSIAKGRLVYPGPTDLPHAWAYLPDLARAFVAVAAQPDHPPFEALPFEGHTLTGQQLLDAVEAAAADLGLRPAEGFRRGGMPWSLLRALGWVVPMLREVVRMRYLWFVPHALDGRALAQRAGRLPATPVPQAMRQALLDLGLGGASAARPRDALSSAR